MKNNASPFVLSMIARITALTGLMMMLTAGTASAQITMTLGTVTAKTGDTVSVPISVSGFSNVGAISLKINYSGSALQYLGLTGAPSGVVFTSNAANNVITLGWFDASAVSPINLGSGVLVNLKMIYQGGTGPLTFATSACDIASEAGTSFVVSYVNGSVGTPPLSLTLGTVQAPLNGVATVPITVTNFTQIGAVSLKIQYDPAVLQFDSLANVPSSMSFTRGASGGVLTLAWFDPTGATPVTIGSGKLMDLKFTMKDDSSAVTFLSGQSEISNGSGVDVAAQYTNGKVTRATIVKPTITPIPPITKKEQDTVIIVVTATDPNPGDVLTYSATGMPAGATFNPATRTFTWIPALNTAGVYPVEFIVSNGSLKDSTSAVITITKNNIKPTFASIPAITKREQDTVLFVVSATDPNIGDVLTYTASGLPTGATFTASTRTFQWVPALNTAGTYTVRFVVSDGQLTDSTNAVITITKNNLKPVFVSRTPALFDSVQLAYPNSVIFSVKASDPNGDVLTFTWKMNGVVVKSGPDSTYDAKGKFTALGPQVLRCVFADNGGLSDSTTWNFTVVSRATGVAQEADGVPTQFALGQNYPNPFNPSTTIKFALPKAAPVTLEVFNILGEKVRTLVSGTMMSAAFHSVVWDGRNDAGSQVASGMYLYRIAADNQVATMKMLLMK